MTHWHDAASVGRATRCTDGIRRLSRAPEYTANMLRRSVLVSVLALCLTVSGCGGDDTATRAESSAAPGGSSTTAPASSASASSSTVGPSSTTTATSASNGDAGCISARWELLADQISQLFSQNPLARMPGFSVNTTGHGYIEFKDDGTYQYTPNYSVSISVNGISGSGQWSGTLDGTWKLDGNTLTMAQTANALTGSINVMGTTIPMPSNRSFSGSATLVSCQPETLKYELDSPMGRLTTTLVLAS